MSLDDFMTDLDARFEFYADKLPVLNKSVAGLWLLKNNPTTTIDDVIQVVTKDPTLAARILSVANSALFPQFNGVTVVSRAVNLLGIERSIALAEAVSASNTASNCQSQLILTRINQVGQRLLTMACGCKWLVYRKDISQAETAALTALLHDLGGLLVLKAVDFNQVSVTECQLTDVLNQHSRHYTIRLFKYCGLPDLYTQAVSNLANPQYTDQPLITASFRFMHDFYAFMLDASTTDMARLLRTDDAYKLSLDLITLNTLQTYLLESSYFGNL